MQGRTLAEELAERGAYDEKEAYSVLIDLADVLAELYGTTPDIVHGDISPSTILRSEEDRKLLLMDFGMLKDATQIVQSNGGKILSTTHMPAYAPPERKKGQLRPTSDVYTLGATLLGLLSGRHLDELYSPGTHQWAHQNIKVSENIKLLLRMMLARSTAERLQVATSIRSVLKHITSGKEYFDLGKYDNAASEWNKAYELAKNPALKTKIEEAEKLAAGGTTCPQCGAQVKPGQDLCEACEFKKSKDELRPLVEAAVIADNILSEDEKVLILRAAAEKGIPNQVAEAVIKELLSALGASEEGEAPKLEVRPSVLKFERLKKGSQPHETIEIRNVGNGELKGKIISNTPWLKVAPTILDPRVKKQLITVKVDTNCLSHGLKETESIRIESNGGKAAIDVHVEIEPVLHRRVEAEPAPPSTPLAKICPKCQTSNTPAHKYCTQCGWDLSQPWAAPATLCPKCDAENPSDNKYCLNCSWELARVWPAEEGRKKPKKTKYVLAGISALAVMIILGVIWTSFFSLGARILQKLEKGRLVTPVGDSAYDLWQKLRAEDPDSDALTEIASKALASLRSGGREAFRRLHDDAQEPDWSEMTRVYDWALQLDPADQELKAQQQYMIGRIAFREKRFQEALNAYEEALKYKEGWGLAYNGIGRVYANQRDYNRAAHSYQKAIQFDPQWCFPYLNLGGVYLELSNRSRARYYYRRAVDACPNRPSAHYLLARFYHRLDRPRHPCNALREYEIAVRLARGNPSPGFKVERVRQRINSLRRRCN